MVNRWALWEAREDDNCYYCRMPMTKPVSGTEGNVSPLGTEATLDHYRPLSRGGTNDPSNLVLACRHCNDLKGSLTAEEFESSIGYMVEMGFPLESTIRTPSGPIYRAIEVMPIMRPFLSRLRGWAGQTKPA